MSTLATHCNTLSANGITTYNTIGRSSLHSHSQQSAKLISLQTHHHTTTTRQRTATTTMALTTTLHLHPCRHPLNHQVNLDKNGAISTRRNFTISSAQKVRHVLCLQKMRRLSNLPNYSMRKQHTGGCMVWKYVRFMEALDALGTRSKGGMTKRRVGVWWDECGCEESIGGKGGRFKAWIQWMKCCCFV